MFAVDQSVLVGVLNATMDLIKLTRKHSIKMAPGFSCSVEDCSLAVGKVVGQDTGGVQQVSQVSDRRQEDRQVSEGGQEGRAEETPETPTRRPSAGQEGEGGGGEGRGHGSQAHSCLFIPLWAPLSCPLWAPLF